MCRRVRAHGRRWQRARAVVHDPKSQPAVDRLEGTQLVGPLEEVCQLRASQQARASRARVSSRPSVYEHWKTIEISPRARPREERSVAAQTCRPGPPLPPELRRRRPPSGGRKWARGAWLSGLASFPRPQRRDVASPGRRRPPQRGHVRPELFPARTILDYNASRYVRALEVGLWFDPYGISLPFGW